MSEAWQDWQDAIGGIPPEAEYVDVRRPQAILVGEPDRAYGHVRADSPLTVITPDGEWKTYSSVWEILADGWELA